MHISTKIKIQRFGVSNRQTDHTGALSKLQTNLDKPYYKNLKLVSPVTGNLTTDDWHHSRQTFVLRKKVTSSWTHQKNLTNEILPFLRPRTNNRTKQEQITRCLNISLWVTNFLRFVPLLREILS